MEDKANSSICHSHHGLAFTYNCIWRKFSLPNGRRYDRFGLVVGLDYKDHTLDVHSLLQKLKRHPLFAQYLEGGEILEWGAKTIPEGGFYSLQKNCMEMV